MPKKLALTTLMVLALLAPIRAQSSPTQPPPSKPAQDEFVPVDSPVSPQDVMPAPRLVAIAYGFIWLAFFGYLASVKMRLSKVEKEIEVVSRRAASGGQRP
jgi:CcmD family protein